MVTLDNAKKLRELIRFIERKLGVLEDGEMACCGVTMAQCHALVEIGRAGSISLVDLAKLLDLDNSTMSRTVNNLVNKKLVDRRVDPTNRRYVTIKLTPDGIKSFNEIESKMESYFLQILSAIPDDKHEQVLESLQLLLKAISESECCT
jgi:DNA-binding MarR family transcriptional regulator